MKVKKQFLIVILFPVLVILSASTTGGKEFNIYDYTWLEGRWVGTGLGGSTESIWSAPAENGTMVGVFRHFNAQGVADFYQFLTLDKDGLKVKHFSGDLVGWEDKKDYVTFKMVDFSKHKIEMESLIYEQKSKNELEVRLIVKRDGKEQVEVFNRKRVK